MVNPFVWLVDKLADLVGPIELEDLTEDDS